MSSKQSTKPSKPTRQVAKQAAVANAQQQVSQDARKQAQQEKQKQAAAAAERRKRNILIRNVAIVAAVVIVLGGGLTYMYFKDKDARDLAAARAADYAANPPGELVAQQNSPHIDTLDTAHDPYTTSPPTSGPHVPQVPLWKVYDQPIANELQVHALEDAGVVVNYRPDLDRATVDRLAVLVKSYSDFAVESKDNFDNHVLMSPYTDLDHPIVLTAWQRILRLDTFDEARIKRFIDAYKNIDHHEDSGS